MRKGVAAEVTPLVVSLRQWPKNLKQEPVFLNAQMGDKYDMVMRQ